MKHDNTPRTVALFGSARPLETTAIYKAVHKQAALLTDAGWTIATGGGPGLMEAANKGAQEHCCYSTRVCSLGYSIYLPFEPTTNPHVDVDSHHQTFFTRLEEFCDCDAFIANPGGIGTLLEVLMVAQLNQVGIMDKPLILVGEMWRQIMVHAYDNMLAGGYISKGDSSCWQYADTPEEAATQLISRFK